MRVENDTLAHVPGRGLGPVGHGFAGPSGGLVCVAKGAWVGDLVLVGHRGGDETEGVGVDHGAGHTFALDLRHVAGDALTAGAAVFVVRVGSERGSVRSVG